MYGEGATYDSIEGRFRIIKADAKALKQEADARGARGQSATANRTTNSANSTPRKARSRKAVKGEPSSPTKSSRNQAVLSGRVAKAPTSAKAKKTANLKTESEEGMASASFTSASSTGAGISDDFSDLLVAGLPNQESLSEGQVFGDEDGVGYYDEEDDDGV